MAKGGSTQQYQVQSIIYSRRKNGSVILQRESYDGRKSNLWSDNLVRLVYRGGLAVEGFLSFAFVHKNKLQKPKKAPTSLLVPSQNGIPRIVLIFSKIKATNGSEPDAAHLLSGHGSLLCYHCRCLDILGLTCAVRINNFAKQLRIDNDLTITGHNNTYTKIFRKDLFSS